MSFLAVNTQQIEDVFTYTRYEYRSEALNKNAYFGVIKPNESEISLESIYFLHGGDGNDQQFLSADFLKHLTSETKKMLVERRVQIVLLDIGLSYLKHPYDQYMLLEVMPKVEMGMNTESRRHLYGISMGGTAAFNIFLKKPSLFRSLAAHFPGLIEFNPFDDAVCHAYQSKSQISDEKLAVLRWCYTTPFTDHDEFILNDPHTILSKIDPLEFKGKKIFWDCANGDDYGLNFGAQIFHEKLNALGISNEMNLRPGKHEIAFALSGTEKAFQKMLE